VQGQEHANCEDRERQRNIKMLGVITQRIGLQHSADYYTVRDQTKKVLHDV
jgi:hypothetical protein